MTVTAPLHLDVLFTRDGADYRAQVIRSPVGEYDSVAFSNPLTELDLESFALEAGSLRARTQRFESPSAAAGEQVGGWLFDAVFAGTARECLRRSLDWARSKQVALWIRLQLADCPELGVIPWELLYDQGEGRFLALFESTPIIRYIQMPEPPRAVEVELPLRILVIKSEPADYPPLDLEAEWGQVAPALAELTDAGMIKCTELAEASLRELRSALRLDPYHVLHYMGHGVFDPEHGATLVFTNRAGNGVPATSRDLDVLLHDHSSLQLAVINACETARASSSGSLRGVAVRLARSVPAVVAMQFEVTDEVAAEFAPALYGALTNGRSVDAAVAEARKAMFTISLVEWAAPVLYLRADDARLFDVTRRARSRGPAAASTTRMSGIGPSSPAVGAGQRPARQRPPARPYVVEVSDDTYQVEVIKRSMTLLVLVEMWAESCEPCRQLNPVLERLAMESAGKWVLAKVDADANPRLRASLRVQQIPMVAAMIRGQNFDGFYGNPTEADLRRWIGRVLQDARRLRL